MSEKLELCPFCAGRAEWRQGHYTGYVMCLSCEVMGPNIDKAEAIAAWNRRAARAEARPALVVDREAVTTLVDRLWQDLCEKDDRNSPPEYPDMLLISHDELSACADEILALLIPATSPVEEEARPRFSEGEVDTST